MIKSMHEHIALYVGVMVAVGVYNILYPHVGVVPASLMSMGAFYVAVWVWPLCICVGIILGAISV